MQGIPQEFVRARPEGVEVPPLAQHLRELGDLDEPPGIVLPFERIHPDGELRVGRVDDDQAVGEILMESAFLFRHTAHDEIRGVAVEVEEQESAAGGDILVSEVPQQIGLACSRFPQQCEMLGAFSLRDCRAADRAVVISNDDAEVEAALVRAALMTPRRAPVPETDEPSFDQSAHERKVRGVATKTVTSRQREGACRSRSIFSSC